MSTTPLACSNCGAALPEPELDSRDGRTVKCPFCGARTPLAIPADQEVQASTATSTRSLTPRNDAIRSKVPRPDSVKMTQGPDGLRLSYRWFSPVFFFLLFFCIAWDSFLVFWYAMALGGKGPDGAFSLIAIIFPIAHVAVGVGLTYFVIAGFLNRTTIDVNQDELRVAHGPVPWKGNRRIPTDDLDQLYSSQNRNQSENSHSYAVSALLKDGRKVTLIGMFHNDEEARFIERTIEDYLGLEHHPVAGEL
jgi:DNA-directed RNA polymerase subunit RPC12/RpoP